jgi:hypothetical protein
LGTLYYGQPLGLQEPRLSFRQTYWMTENL